MTAERKAQLLERIASLENENALLLQKLDLVLARLHRALIRLKTSHRFLPRSAMGKAIDYALNQWSSLLVFLGDGRLEIDNNRIENSIRPTAVGKKNWLFVGDAAAGERSAILYTVIENCRRCGIDPFA